MGKISHLQQTDSMACRAGCGACCIAPSISSPIPGMPQGKPAGVRCIQLDEANRCRLFNQPERPAVCEQFSATVSICGDNDAQALHNLQWLERQTG
ncbi:MAG: YkgJ family cysteine cluster protein [Thiohalophilus sp.]|nr:YkgJ family cysteine cluster protein [Thiohalophilus sp.]MDZ7662093.1 YkgJ family cysteine cluster protein [Thiohalophilus sp.]